MKYVVILFFTFGLVLGFVSCGEDHSNTMDSQNVVTDTIHVDIGFPSAMSTFEYKEKSYFYFYDLVSYKKVKIYDGDMKLLKTFSLEDYINAGYDLSGIEMVTPDSALLLTDYLSNILIAVNLKTQKTQKVFLNSLLDFKEKDMVLELWPTFDGEFLFNGKVALAVSPSVTQLNMTTDKNGKIGGMKMFDSLNLLLPYYVIIDKPFSEQVSVELIHKSKKFKSVFENAMFGGLNFTYLYKNKLIYTNHFTDYFDIHTLNGGEVQKPIVSKYTDIGVPTREWSEIENNPEVTSFGNIDFKNAGRVTKIFYNPKKNQFNVILFHSKSRNPDPDGDVTPFIWQVYDQNFILLSEKQYTPTKLMQGSAVATNKHVYFTYYDEKTYDPNKKVLVRFPF